MKIALKIAGLLVVLYVCTLLMQVDVLGQGQHYPRFHRLVMTRLDDTTVLDMVKDTAKPGMCRLVYRVREIHRGPLDATSSRIETYPVIAVAYLGEVPCDPAPVPVPVPIAASPVKSPLPGGPF